MKKFNTRTYLPIIFIMTIVFGVLTILNNEWFILAVVCLSLLFVYVRNRADYISYYCIGVDLNTNTSGDVIEFYIYAFNAIKNSHFPVKVALKQLNIFVNVNLLDRFYENIGYSIKDEPLYGIRKIIGSETPDLSVAKSQFTKLIIDFKTNYEYSGSALREHNMEPPKLMNKPKKSKLLSLWAIKTNA